MALPCGVGSVGVAAEVEGGRWTTSLFPDEASAGLLLPARIGLCRRVDIKAKQEVSGEREHAALG
jgi:hypothetical protein